MTTDNESEHSPFYPAAQPSILPPPPELPPGVKPGRKRLASVIVIAILFFIGAAVEITGLFQSSHVSGTLTIINRTDSVLFCLAQIIVGIGLLQSRPPARIAAIIILIVRYLTMVTLTLVEVMQFGVSAEMAIVGSIVVFTVALVYFGILIFFLTRPGVKAAFTEERTY